MVRRYDPYPFEDDEADTRLSGGEIATLAVFALIVLTGIATLIVAAIHGLEIVVAWVE